MQKDCITCRLQRRIMNMLHQPWSLNRPSPCHIIGFPLRRKKTPKIRDGYVVIRRLSLEQSACWFPVTRCSETLPLRTWLSNAHGALINPTGSTASIFRILQLSYNRHAEGQFNDVVDYNGARVREPVLLCVWVAATSPYRKSIAAPRRRHWIAEQVPHQ